MTLGIRRALIHAAADSERRLSRLTRSAYDFLGGAACSGLSSAEVEALSVALYERRLPEYRGLTLFDWEESILPRVLPPPPARLLITSAGTGREAFALRARGYEVFATEPTHVGCQALRQELGERVRQCGLMETAAELKRHGFQPDAVLIGWGGISHVLDTDRREDAIVKLCGLTPGPVIGSIYIGDVDSPAFASARRLFGNHNPVGWGFNPLNGYYARVDEFELHFWARRTKRELTVEAPVQPRVFVLRSAR